MISGVLGLFFPPLLLLALVSAVFAMMSAPAGLRADGEPKTGGLLGGVWDYIVIKDKMTECPYCDELILRHASKCKHCGEWVDDEEGTENEDASDEESEASEEDYEQDEQPAR